MHIVTFPESGLQVIHATYIDSTTVSNRMMRRQLAHIESGSLPAPLQEPVRIRLAELAASRQSVQLHIFPAAGVSEEFYSIYIRTSGRYCSIIMHIRSFVKSDDAPYITNSSDECHRRSINSYTS